MISRFVFVSRECAGFALGGPGLEMVGNAALVQTNHQLVSYSEELFYSSA